MVGSRILPVNQKLVALQSEVRADFGWSLDRDEEVSHKLKALYDQLFADSELCSATIGNLRLMVQQSKSIAVLGAAVEPEHLSKLPSDTLLVAADGSVGVFAELDPHIQEWAWRQLALVVSDGDGGRALLEAVERDIAFALHAHGDNLSECTSLLKLLAGGNNPLILTHQCAEPIDGMENPGGFTDGDRAVCIIAGLGANVEDIQLLGFRSDKVGRWTGVTDERRKLRKLKWMDAILAILREGGQ